MTDLSKTCPDGGTCHHECKTTGLVDCFRVATCTPLSNVYVDDEWPVDAEPVSAKVQHVSDMSTEEYAAARSMLLGNAGLPQTEEQHNPWDAGCSKRFVGVVVPDERCYICRPLFPS